LPSVEEGRPVDIAGQFVQRVVIQHLRTQEAGLGNGRRFPIGLEAIGAGRLNGEVALVALAAGVVFAQRRILVLNRLLIRVFARP
nr:hypothetical protein [Tanacetum cinerariifolium]